MSNVSVWLWWWFTDRLTDILRIDSPWNSFPFGSFLFQLHKTGSISITKKNYYNIREEIGIMNLDSISPIK